MGWRPTRRQSSGYLVFVAVCSVCTHRWTVIAEPGWRGAQLECPCCGRMAGEPEED